MIDKTQPKGTAYWFPFAPPTGNVMYCMLKMGTHASLYLPDETEHGARVLECVRKNGGDCAKTGNPNTRYFGTEHGSEMELSPGAIHLVSGCKEPLKMSIEDGTGITITSHKKLTLQAGQDISLYTPKRIAIRAQSQLVAKKTSAPSGVSIESEYHFLSEMVKAKGTDRTTYPPFDDEPKKGEAPKPAPPPAEEAEPSFSWGNLLVVAVAAVAVVGLVALSVATFGAGAAAIGAALGAVGGIASTARSDAENQTTSSLAEYAASAAKGAIIGAISGAILGPVGGAGVLGSQTTGQLMKQFGASMFANGVGNAADHTLHEMWEGRIAGAGDTVRALAEGALFAGFLGTAVKAGGKIIEFTSPWMKERVKRIANIEIGSPFQFAGIPSGGNRIGDVLQDVRDSLSRVIPGKGNGAGSGPKPNNQGTEQASIKATDKSAIETAKKAKSLREQYLGRTPSKNSRTGREVIEQMKQEGKIRTARGGKIEFKASDGKWYNIKEADMAHKTDAVTWWNNTGRYYGAKSKEVREWMLDSKNYYLEHYSINRSQGAKLTERYLPPIK